MYNTAQFREEQADALHALIGRHPLAAIVAATSTGLSAEHLPVLLDAARGAHGVLRGHVARANPMWRALPAGSQVLAIFMGADAYVTPSWYATKRETGMVVPTWNYLVVHVHGRIRWIDGGEELRAIITDLTDRHEGTRAEPWAVTDAPPDFIDNLSKAIVGFEIEIDGIEGKRKASQNRDPQDRAGVAAGFAADGRSSEELAELVSEPKG